MKLTEVVTQLQLLMPQFTDLFSNTLNVTSIVASGGVASINADTHGLLTNDPVTISEISQENPIISVSRDGLLFTFETSINHDLTLDDPNYETVTIGGFTDSVWNDSFSLVGIPDRTNFIVQSTNPNLPILNSNEYLAEIRIDGINGRYPVTVLDVDNFTVSGNFEDGDYLGGTIKTAVRIAGSVSIERAFEQYTKQIKEDLWMFVTMNDAVTSKNRTAYNDAIATIAANEDIRTRLIDGFSVFLIMNVNDETAAVDAVDVCRHDLLSPICKSLFGARFSTGLSGAGDFAAILTGHNFVQYDRATFVYQYGFEFTNDLTLEDAVKNTDTRAFSEIDFTQVMGGDDTEDLTFDAELPS